MKGGDGGTDAEGTGASTGDGSGGTGPGDATGDPGDATGDPGESGGGDEAGEPTVNAVDVLLVVDDSGSMAEEQAALAASLSTLVLELDALGTDYHIGITTTDNGNPWCKGTSPEGGRLVASSCRERLDDFVFMGAVTIDATETACLAVCPEQWSTIALAEPWIEVGGGATNLPEGLDPATALACMAPQGIAGCGFEQHLESVYGSLSLAQDPAQPEFGFMRPDALLAVVVLTDEVDCSHNPDHQTIFFPESTGGNEVFWSNPGDAAPTSAVCWNAGVECINALDGSYEDCLSVDLGVDGSPVAPGAAGTDAVLRPVSRYVDLLAQIEDTKRALNPGAQVLFSLLGGVMADGSLHYADAGTDPQFPIDFGIAPGCESDFGRAVPPVRLREVAAAQLAGEARNMFSVCVVDYSEAFSALADAIEAHLP